jgi:ATP-dependent 26S proteasome regulatory subunit
MAATFPKDINCKQGAVHSIGNDFYVLSREQELESLLGVSQTVTLEEIVMNLPNNTDKEVKILDFNSKTRDIYDGGTKISGCNYGVRFEMKENINLNVSSTNVVYFTSSVSGEVVSYVPK